MEIDGTFKVRDRVVELVSSLVDLGEDLPQMVFKSVGWQFRFFERPVLLHDEIMSSVIESSFDAFGSGVFVKFSRSCDNDSIVVIDGSNVGRAVDLVAEAYKEGSMDIGYPVVFGDLEGRWIGFESAREELGVIAVEESAQGRKFMLNLCEGVVSAGDLRRWTQEGGGWEKIVEAFLASYDI